MLMEGHVSKHCCSLAANLTRLLNFPQMGKGTGGSKALVEKLVREMQKVQEQLRAQTAARQRAEGDAATAEHEAKAAVGMRYIAALSSIPAWQCTVHEGFRCPAEHEAKAAVGRGTMTFWGTLASSLLVLWWNPW